MGKKQVTVTLTKSDEQKLEFLKKKFDMDSEAELFRMAFRFYYRNNHLIFQVDDDRIEKLRRELNDYRREVDKELLEVRKLMQEKKRMGD